MTCLRQINPDVPVILASGYSEEQTMEEHHHLEQPQAFLGKLSFARAEIQVKNIRINYVDQYNIN